MFCKYLPNTMRSQYDNLVVTIQDGKLRGTIGENLDGEIFLKFFGIPYGKPPVNELRFKPPQPADPWEGVKNATEVGSASISRDDLTYQVVGSEDCLYLNVYTKKLPNSNSGLKPVMVYIHGGGFVSGSSRPGLCGPEFLMIKDIVLVTLNYRLGALGFLSIDNTEISGNMGLKDQNLALKWIQRNIKSFNGDPNNVTLFGESAGAGSVHAHILSQSSKGLFHKALLQSGCSLNPWFWGTKNNARELVSHLGKLAESEQEALEILKKVPALDIFSAQEKLSDSFYPMYKRPFGSVIENQNETAFLNKDPRELMREGSYNQVPIVIGYTETEGMLIDIAAKFNIKIPPFEMENVIPYELNVQKGSDESRQISDILKKLYTGDSHHYPALTDGLFLAGIIESLRSLLNTANNSIYLYRISVTSQVNHLKRVMQKLDEPGVCHADDLGYLWHSDITPEIKPGSMEDRSIRAFVGLWTNFAQFGDPTPDNELNISWQPVESMENLKLVDIGETLQITNIPERKRMKVWREIYGKWQPMKHV